MNKYKMQLYLRGRRLRAIESRFDAVLRAPGPSRQQQTRPHIFLAGLIFATHYQRLQSAMQQQYARTESSE